MYFRLDTGTPGGVHDAPPWQSWRCADISLPASGMLWRGLPPHQGINMCNGDATVPLVSTGLMCRKWRHNKRLNPAGIKVTTVEFPHTVAQTLRFDLRGGPQASDHLDIMLNEAMINSMAQASSGAVDEIPNQIVSNIDSIERTIKLPGDGDPSVEDVLPLDPSPEQQEQQQQQKARNDEL